MVPLTNPLPARELQILQRLKKFRCSQQLSRVGFGQRIGLDSSTIANLEHGRTALKCGVALKIHSAFKINLGWLATGLPICQQDFGIPKPEEIEAWIPDLFSTAYDQMLKHRITQNWDSFRFSADEIDRYFMADTLKKLALDLMIKVPDQHLLDCANQLIVVVQEVLKKYPKDTAEAVLKRLAEFKSDLY